MKEQNKLINLLIYIFYPITLVLIIEYNHMQDINKLIEFISTKFSVFIFSVILTSLLFLVLLLFTKKSYIAVAIQSIILYILSTVEYFKYKTSGTHLTLSDLAMTQNISDVGKFAKLELTFPLFFSLVLIILIILLCKKFEITLTLTFRKRTLGSFLFLIVLLCGILLPSTSTNIYATFSLDNQLSTNIFDINKSFENNGLIGFLSQTTSKEFYSYVHKPQEYTYEHVKESLVSSVNNDDDFIKPNIIFIMSESFGDFRSFKSNSDINNYYVSFDNSTNKGFLGECIVPTFGGYTPRTEFELLFGLPVYSLNTPSIPHSLLDEKITPETIPSYFKSLGYNTTYIHPFSGSFYSRNTTYKEYGFDNLYFEEDMVDNTTRFRRYIDDKSVFEIIKDQLINDTTSSYIFTTTMQNHQPYYDETSNLSELDYYLEGIKKTSEDLDDFISWLNDFNEDSIVVFVGDHFPFFSPTSNIYEDLGINSNNTENLYKQKYLILNNFNKDYSYIGSEKISTFYLPYIIIDSIGTSTNQFISTILNELKETPIYSPNIQSKEGRNETLDLLTYDRVMGENYSK